MEKEPTIIIITIKRNITRAFIAISYLMLITRWEENAHNMKMHKMTKAIINTQKPVWNSVQN
jgi:hypothetical protein